MAAPAVRSMVATHSVNYTEFVDDNIGVRAPAPLAWNHSASSPAGTVRATVSYR